MSGEQFLQYIFAGITVGSIYAFVAIGYNIIYNTTGIINFAQGEFVMLGGMIAYTFSGFMPLLPAIVSAVLITALVGGIIENVFIRRMRKTSVMGMIVITIGISILLREAALYIWDEQIRALSFFTGSEVSSVNIFGARISPQVLWVLGVTVVIVSGLFFFLKYTLTGQAMRACSENPRAAKLCGIRTDKMVNLSFMLSAGIGALGGCVVSPLTQTHYAMGSDLAIKGFTVAILGGLGNPIAAVAAGLLLGLIEAFSISILPMAFKDVIAIVILLVILVAKPSGLFGSSQASSLKDY
ncbi:branched-chain amino acid ABC transporter permease [Oceanispirochaeta sp.]|jgi:branched-chain amino acid transport system permease protein|uniref:branched-chain amino acid ABC transporter permease n=1 Tax=Oceanispirochaeta sp. TaxID=2035350 RepID=UPI00261FDC77|nr:branched-chain amino acid ABC transporter permease [Oceanispirochaeta sp.]MDA3955705.1 branched-chain amino acid ABC transporter permease [Oceanispirochaeta sp.]